MTWVGWWDWVRCGEPTETSTGSRPQLGNAWTVNRLAHYTLLVMSQTGEVGFTAMHGLVITLLLRPGKGVVLPHFCAHQRWIVGIWYLDATLVDCLV